jgi:hypothetical protein
MVLSLAASQVHWCVLSRLPNWMRLRQRVANKWFFQVKPKLSLMAMTMPDTAMLQIIKPKIRLMT